MVAVLCIVQITVFRYPLLYMYWCSSPLDCTCIGVALNFLIWCSCILPTIHVIMEWYTTKYAMVQTVFYCIFYGEALYFLYWCSCILATVNVMVLRHSHTVHAMVQQFSLLMQLYSTVHAYVQQSSLLYMYSLLYMIQCTGSIFMLWYSSSIYWCSCILATVHAMVQRSSIYTMVQQFHLQVQLLYSFCTLWCSGPLYMLWCNSSFYWCNCTCHGLVVLTVS